jgi:hypothetical protein
MSCWLRTLRLPWQWLASPGRVYGVISFTRTSGTVLITSDFVCAPPGRGYVISYRLMYEGVTKVHSFIVMKNRLITFLCS